MMCLFPPIKDACFPFLSLLRSSRQKLLCRTPKNSKELQRTPKKQEFLCIRRDEDIFTFFPLLLLCMYHACILHVWYSLHVAVQKNMYPCKRLMNNQWRSVFSLPYFEE